MADEKLPAYFVQVPAKARMGRSYFVIVRPSRDFWKRYNKVWARFTKSAELTIRLHGEKTEVWQARVRDRPSTIDPLGQHSLQQNDLVLQALPASLSEASISEFETSDQANAASDLR